MTCHFLEQLLTRGRVCLLTLHPVSLAELDQRWGTRLAESALEVTVVDSLWLKFAQALKLPRIRLECHILCREARKLVSHYQYCTVVGEELDLQVPCLQYLYYPNRSLEVMRRLGRQGRPVWWNLLLWLNIFFCQLLCKWDDSAISKNFTVLISGYVGEVFQKIYRGRGNFILFPPPTVEPQGMGGERRLALLAIGRIARIKQWTSLISLLDQLRAEGYEVGLTIAGYVEEQAYYDELVQLKESRNDWFRLRTNISREELNTEIAGHEFGIHMMPEEHYGMAVAELLLGGCLTLVHDSGGQVEIVTEPELRFRDLQDGARKLKGLLASDKERERLKASQQARRQAYTLEAFRDSFHRCLDEYEAWAAPKL